MTHALPLGLPVLLLAACSGEPTHSPEANTPIAIDGSSTVYPITEAVAEAFRVREPQVRLTIGVSGTGGGMKKLCAGEVAVAGASRPIKVPEVEACAARGISFLELPVAYDGIAVVTHPSATWMDHVTVDELRTLWRPEAQQVVTKWSSVRPGWPEEPIHLFGPGVDSGTYDYFTAAIVGVEHSSRGDFTSSEDDNVLVQGVASDASALGFFGLAWYEENRDRLRLVPVDDGRSDNGAGPILPSVTTVRDGTYQPLARPLFLYVALDALSRPEVVRFLDFYLGEGRALAGEVGYIPLSDAAADLTRKRFTERKAGSVFSGGAQVGLTVEDLLTRER